MGDCYRKKLVVIEAMQLDTTFERSEEVTHWVRVGGGKITAYSTNMGRRRFYELGIETPEGTMRAVPGDWIIRGVQGEFYPCKPDIFEACYERDIDGSHRDEHR